MDSEHSHYYRSKP
jgi:hypothetical protein